MCILILKVIWLYYKLSKILEGVLDTYIKYQVEIIINGGHLTFKLPWQIMAWLVLTLILFEEDIRWCKVRRLFDLIWLTTFQILVIII